MRRARTSGILHAMLVYAGIDEAGYGPMLGPLCVACSVFVVNDHDPDHAGACDLWKRLKKAVCRKRTDRRGRIAIDDSKKLKLANDAASHPLRHLERGVLSFLACNVRECEAGGESATPCPACDGDLYAQVGVAVTDHDWFRGSIALPVTHTCDELRIAMSRLRRIMAAESIECALIRCEAIDPEAFNHQCDQMGSKASVNFCSVLRLIDDIWRRWPSRHPRVIVDRQGGRVHYLNDLMHAWPEAQVQVLSESDALSRYRLDRGGSKLTLSFLVEAESAHLPVALASMTAKYVRELLMQRLNRYFTGLMPELKPTAGYTEDARRYLADINPLLDSLGIDRRKLIRSS